MIAVRSFQRICIAGVLALVGALAFASTSQAAFGIVGFDGETVANQTGAPYTQAGGHPYAASTTIEFNATTDSGGQPIPDQSVKQIQVDLPAGFVGNPLATPSLCTEAELTGGKPISVGVCPVSSQVGTATLNLGVFGILTVPVYNMVPAADEPAQLGIRFLTTDVHIEVAVRKGDYGITAELNDVSNALPLIGSTVTLWGVPADPSHDAQRGQCGDPFEGGGLCPANAPLKPFVTMPTACTPVGTGVETDLRAKSWLGSADSATFVSHLPPGLPNPGPPQGPTGCDGVPFDPDIDFDMTSEAADSPTGVNVDITIPQAGLESTDGTASAHLKDAVVVFPQGVSVNPASATGLGSCTSAQVDLESTAEANCPDSSKIGSLQVETPLLKDPVEGSVYLAAQSDNPFSSLLAIYIVAKGPGFVLKLPGRVETDPNTGRLTTIFTDNPQLPFSALHLRFFGGSKAPLRTPSTCGSYSIDVEFTPWSSNDPVELSDQFAITTGPGGGPCPSGGEFSPKLSAGTSNPLAGQFSPFHLRLTRNDGEQELQGLSLGLPKGLLGKLAGIPPCPAATLESISTAPGTGASQLQSPSCPSTSQIGTVSVSAGAGDTPLFVNTGRVYLSGPYKGSPLSVAVVAPAVAGPFDLGSVVVRTALTIDPVTAEISAVSDPLPRILEGIPLDLRDVRISLDRSEFTLNPTSCDPMAFDGVATSVSGQTGAIGDHFQVGSCGNLGFKPRLNVQLFGGTKRGDNPRLKVVLRPRAGDANIARAVVALPRSEFLDQSHIKTICTRRQFAVDQCPAASIYGFARAFTPLLDQPVEGPVYLRSSSNLLPDLVVALRGPAHQPIELDLAGRIDSVKGGIRSTFAAVPDAPVTKFVLTMKGGEKSLIVNSRNLCAAKSRADARFTGQNGSPHDFRPLVRPVGCGKERRDGKRGPR